MPMRMLNNIENTVKEDLKAVIKKGSKISVAASYFSIYAYRELRKQLDGVAEFRFIFTAPTFIKEKAEKQKREFYIPRLNRENSLYGTEFEIKLRNEMTQRAIARECADWVRRVARFKSNATSDSMAGFMTVSTKGGDTAYYPMNGFTTVDLGCERGNNLFTMVNAFDEAPCTAQYMALFDSLWNDRTKMQDVTDIVLENIETAYNENSPEFIYFVALYNVFSEFLSDISEDVMPNEATGFKQSKIWSLLYDFQKDAALAIINKLEKYNGCILADSVGLGKTFTALAVVKYYENRNKSVLVLCPKKLAENWNTYKDNYVNNPIAADRLNYDVLFHTDLSRKGGTSNGLDLDRLNWGNYDLIVIDESHNFRNGIGTHSNKQENRYQRLMEKVIRAGVKTKVLMLSATPVNNRFSDLQNQLAIAYEGVPEQFNRTLNTQKGVEEIFKSAQKAYNAWCKREAQDKTTESLLRSLDFDFFELLDSVTIARSRKHIERYYDIGVLGSFPKRLPPDSVRPRLSAAENAINYSEIYDQLSSLSLAVYAPSNYIFPSRAYKYQQPDKDGNLTQIGRELGILRLMRINLLKRLESSVHSFRLTIRHIKDYIDHTVEVIDLFEKRSGAAKLPEYETLDEELDIDDENAGAFTVGRLAPIDLADMDYVSFRAELQKDAETLARLISMTDGITPERDAKLHELLSILSDKIEHPINPGNKKAIIFSAFSDTAEYLYEHVSRYIKKKYGLDTAVVTGSVDGRTTVKGLKCTLNNVLTCFSPVSKGKELLMPDNSDEIDILIATDCISEGQNLQDCDYLINYDIHWNPVRIIQRFGRIDRIGSKNAVIKLVNFWPDIELDDYINLTARVELRMKAAIMAATGDENPIDDDDAGDLEYRRRQLKRLQEEVVDIEDMSGGVSIMDLGLNEFRLDLVDYVKTNGDMDKIPRGLHAVAPASGGLPSGAVFILRNVNDSVHEGSRNRIHPFYMVYVKTDGSIECGCLDPKKLLDDLRLLCRGKSEPVREVYEPFNRETRDGEDMTAMSELLSRAIESIIDAKERSDIDSLFSPGGTTALINDVSGLDDFELVCFLAVR